MKTLIDRLPNRVREFLADRKGNAAILFALATVPMVGFVGAAVDYSHAASIKAAMQAAADATALAMSKSVGSYTASQLQTTATPTSRPCSTVRRRKASQPPRLTTAMAALR